nr:PREDICTED: probable protein arginine N-methyltransferase 6 isoform X1 [Daucus carota subsp. sativus]
MYSIKNNHNIFRCGDHQRQVSDDDEETEIEETAYDFHDFNIHQAVIKVVVDVGSGTGILSIFCAQAGAKRVYAVEDTEIALQAQKVMEANNLSERDIVLHGYVEDVGINKKVDVIVSDWMDQLLLYNYENMLGSVLTARDRLLKPNGLIMPSSATLYIAPVTLPDRYSSKIDFWRNVYGIDMSAMVPWAIQDAYEDPCVEKIKSEHLLALPQVVKRVDCYTINIKELESFKSIFEFQCLTRATFHGFAFWFDVEFRGPVTSPADSNAPPLQSSSNHPTTSGQKRKRDDPIEAIVLSTAPDKPPTHWEQMVVYLNNPIDVEQGHKIEGSVTWTPNQEEDGPNVHIRLEYKSGHRSFVREAVMR